MNNEPVLVIPTCRLRDVGKTVEMYDENFHRYERKINIWVFDDSTHATHKKYYPLLERTSTHNEVHYIGPQEKTEFQAHVEKRTGTTVSDYIIYRMFRPSYGGNRNVALAYTLGRRFISSDDDMQPGGYVIKNGGNELAEGEVMRGETVPDLSKAEWVDFDIAGSFIDILGKSPDTIGMQYGEYLEDPHYDLVTNAISSMRRNGNTSVTSLRMKPASSPFERARVKLAQSFRTGTSDIDAVELLFAFLDSNAADIVDLKSYFVLKSYKPVITKCNYRFDCGVSAYDNEFGLPPFFPTNLRFEDYSFRLWANGREDVAVAHVNSIQHHNRSQYMRPPLTADIYGEMVANFLKKKIAGTIEKVDEYGFAYGYDGVVKSREVTHMLNQAKEVDASVNAAKRREKNESRKEALTKLQYSLRELFKDYEHDTFSSGLSRHIDDQNYSIKDCMLYWPRILEISFMMAKKGQLPIRKVANKRK